MINPAGAVRQLARRDCETPQAAVTNRQGDKHRWNSVSVIEHVFWRVACRTSHDIGQLLTHQVQARAPRMERGLTRGRQGIGHGGPARLSWPSPPTAREHSARTIGSSNYIAGTVELVRAARQAVLALRTSA